MRPIPSAETMAWRQAIMSVDGVAVGPLTLVTDLVGRRSGDTVMLSVRRTDGAVESIPIVVLKSVRR